MWPPMIAVLLGIVTFLAGGVYAWVWMPAAVFVGVLAVGVRPRIACDHRFLTIDLLLMAGAAAMVLQVIPLPAPWLNSLDPHASSLRASLWLPSDIARMPISIVPRQTIAALITFVTAAILFAITREVCEAGGAGRIVRWVAVIGLLAAVAAVVQRRENKELLYGLWRPIDAGARPYGPFVNRNHFATWAIMVCPLVFGYVLARLRPSRKDQTMARRFVVAAQHINSVRSWLIASVCALTLAVVISASRSGVIGLVAAFATSAMLSARSREPATRRWMLIQGVLLAVVVVSFAGIDPLLNRVDETLVATAPIRGRTAIWRDALRLASDFRWTGTGAGTFGLAVVPYQQAEPGYSIGQAHNHYLQLAAEGGFMLSFPVALTFVAFLLLFRRRLMHDHGRDYLIRAGAGAGIAGALIQSFWDTGLRMPANGMLFAVLAAIAVHGSPYAASHGPDS